MSKEKIIEALNEDRAEELAAMVQYMGHHYLAQGLESPALIEAFKKAAIEEMKHTEALAERIVYLGGEPTTKPGRIKKGGDLRHMLQDDLDTENVAIERYRGHIKLCAEAGDPTTRLLLEGILADEERHADDWETALGIRK